MDLIRPVRIEGAKLVASSVPETVAPHDMAINYMKDDEVRVGNLIYKSADDNNLGHPAPDPAYWLGPKASNRWAAFDGVNGTKTVAADISFTVRPGQLVDSLALLDVSANSVSVVASNPTQGEVYNETYVLSNVISEADFYDWFFEPIRRKDNLPILGDLPMVNDLEVTVTLEGDNLSLATFEIGNLWHVGDTEMGADLGIDDYSKYLDDGFGNEVLVQGAYSKNGNFKVYSSKEVADDTYKILTDYRARNLVWIASAEFNATVLYGYAKRWRAVIQYPTYWVYSLDIKGRT